MTLPQGFTDMLRDMLGAEADNLIDALSRPPSVSVRLNPRKSSDAFAGAEPVPWCPLGRYLEERPVFTLDPLLHAGAYYVQDASSMILYELTRRLGDRLRTDADLAGTPPLLVLDACAAPGGKTTAIADAVPDGSLITANEFVAKRAAVLRENTAKWGFPGIGVTNLPVDRLARGGNLYDIVNVDAPCSGEGMMRKDRDAVAQWSPQLIEQCAALQRTILADAAAMVKPGGFLIYSTCTFNRTENEENALWIAGTLGLQPYDPGFPEEWGIARGIGTDLPVYRFMPHRTRGEGLFISVFRKPGDYVPSPLTPRKPSGVANNHKDAGVIPETEEVLSAAYDRSRFPIAEVTRGQALAYLSREAIRLPDEVAKGPVVISYKGLPLGMAKNIGSRANNLYPKNWRIRMDVR